MRPALRALSVLFLACLAGCEQGRERETPPPAPVAPQPAPTVPKGEAITDETDVTADKPEAAASAAAEKTRQTALLNDLEPDGPAGPAGRKCYALLAEMKQNIERISGDLDNGGKEVTRLIRTSDALSKNIGDLANVWPDHEPFRDLCASTRRQALVLNEELERVPRKWTHVRWAFNSALQDVSKLRLRARDLAESEPKPVMRVGKDGKPVTDKEGRIVYVEPEAPPVDPSIARREAAVREARAARERLRKIEEQKKNPPLRTELDK